MKITQIMFLFLVFVFVSVASTQVFGQEKGNACKFNAGPRSGQTQDYSQFPALPLGSPCQDGAGSTGVVVKLVSPNPQSMGNACKFTAGPRAGQTQDYSQLPPLPLDSPCQDGEGSTGVVVALGNPSPKPSPNPQNGPPAGMGNACKFNSGPRSGQTQDYSQLGFLPLDSPCQDGAGSTGTVVATKGGGSTSGGTTGMGNACKFNAGPRAGQTQDYSGQFPPLPLGSPCQDGMSSTGVVVSLGGSTPNPQGGTLPSGMGNACKFNSGPRSGQTQDYSQLGFLPLDSPCTDGQSPASTGTVVALKSSTSESPTMQPTNNASSNTTQGKSKSCMLLTGSKKGSKENFPLPLRIGMPCLTQNGVGIIVK